MADDNTPPEPTNPPEPSNEPTEPPVTPLDELSSLQVEIFQRWSEMRERPLLLINADIEPALLPELGSVLRRELGGHVADLDVLIQSPGGSGHTAYMLAKMLRASCSEFLTTIVADSAKSAATMLALAGDEILMTEMAELGPIDSQVLVGGEYQSALNPFKSLEAISNHFVDVLDMSTVVIYSRSGLSMTEAVEHAIEFVGTQAAPLLNNVAVQQFGETSRALTEGLEYAVRILERGGMVPYAARRIARGLVYNYPSHGFAIDYEEARDLGLPTMSFSEAGIDGDIEWLLTLSMDFAPTGVHLYKAEPPPPPTEHDAPQDTEPAAPDKSDRQAKLRHDREQNSPPGRRRRKKNDDA